MMDRQSKEIFEEIIHKELHALTPNDIAWLKARRGYLSATERRTYEDLNLFDEPIKKDDKKEDDKKDKK